MGTFFHGLTMLFPRLIDHTVEISLLICLIFLAKLLAPKKLPPWWHYSLWLLLLFRMIVPIQFENQLNVFNFVPDMETPRVLEFISESPVETEIQTQPVMMGEVPPKPPRIQAIVKRSLPVVWLSGAMILGICILFETLSFWLCVRRKPVVTDEAVLLLLDESKKRMNIRKKVDIVVTDQVRCPALFGYLRPRLLLPEGVFEKLNEKELSYAFMHELGHLKRHDIGVSWLVAVLQVVHWFNPLVWLAFYQIRIDQESACDAAVLARMKPKHSGDYAKAIVGFLEKFCQNCQLPSLAGVLENRTQMKKRLARIVHYRKTTHRMSVAALILLSSTALVLFSLTGVAARKSDSMPPALAMETIFDPGPAYFGDGQMTAGAENRTEADFGPLEWSPPNGAGAPDAGMDAERSGAAYGQNLTMMVPTDARPAASAAPPMDVTPVHHTDTIVSSVDLPAPADNSPAKAEKRTESGPVAGDGIGPVHKAESKTTAPVYAENRPEVSQAVSVAKNTAPQNDDFPAPPVSPSALLKAVPVPQADTGAETGGRMTVTDSFPMASAEKSVSMPVGSVDGRLDNPSSPDNATPYGMVALAESSHGAGEYGVAVVPVGSMNDATVLSGKQDKRGVSGPFNAIEVDVPPSVIKSYPPRYPYLAKRDDISGSVILQFIVTKEGNAVGTKVVESKPEGIFDETALQAIEQYRFKPGVKDGQAVDVTVNLPIKFNLT